MNISEIKKKTDAEYVQAMQQVEYWSQRLYFIKGRLALLEEIIEEEEGKRSGEKKGQNNNGNSKSITES